MEKIMHKKYYFKQVIKSCHFSFLTSHRIFKAFLRITLIKIILTLKAVAPNRKSEILAVTLTQNEPIFELSTEL